MVAAMAAAAAVPHFHFCDEVKMAALQRVRERLQGDPALQGARLTYMPFILKARRQLSPPLPSYGTLTDCIRRSVACIARPTPCQLP